jgi:putative tricarboxylic transport membrane protein
LSNNVQPAGEAKPQPQRLSQTFIGLGAIAISAGMAYGATGIRSDAGYAGIGPNFLPWLVSAGLAVCGLLLLVHARTGGYRNMPPEIQEGQADWLSFAWVAAGLLLNALLIERIGFILSCSLCYVLAVRGFRRSEGKPNASIKQTIQDIALGFLISAPVYWLFSKALKINLPGLTSSGWL